MSLTRSLEKSKEAYRKKDKAASIAAHKGEYAPEDHRIAGHYIKSAIYGGLDGTITSFAIVAGVAGASLNAGIVLTMGFANLAADGLAMAIGDYISTKSEQEYHAAEHERELWEAKNYPEGEKQELAEIYMEKGLSKPEAEKIVDTVSKNEKVLVDVMMVEELGIMKSDKSAMKNAFVTFFAFAIFGFVPLLAYVISTWLGVFIGATFAAACVLTGVTLFVLGALKTKLTGKNWIRSGAEMLAIGGIASAAAYIIGHLIAGLA